MTFWNYIGEFFLFRWLFGKFKKSATKHNAHTEDIGASIDRDGKHLNDNHDEDIASIDDAFTLVGDNLIDDCNNSEDLDDLDIFMRNNSGKNRSSLHHGDYDGNYHSSGRHSSKNDWNSGSYNQSFDDFHEEQDDYDMMDYDF